MCNYLISKLSGTSALYHNQRGHSFTPLLPQWNQRSISQSERPQFHPCCLSGTSALYHNQRRHSFTPLLPQWNQRSISQSERPQFHPCCLSGTSALYHNQRGHSFTPLLPQWNQRSISQSERPQFHPSVASVEPALYITIREATVSPLCCLSGTSALYHNQRGHSFTPLLPQWNQRSISQSERPQFHPSVASVEPALYITIREATVSPLCCLSGTSALYHNQRGHSFTPLLPQWNQRSISQSERPQFHPSVASVEPALYITIREATVSPLCCLSGTSALYHNQRGHSFTPLLPQWNQRSISQSERPQFHPSVASVEPALYITIREATVSPLCCLSGTSALYHNQRGHSFTPLLPQWNQRSISQSERPQFHPSFASVEPALYITIREATVSPLCCLSGTSALYHNQRGHSFTPLLPQWNQRSISQSERPQFHPSVASVEPALYITIREATVSPLCCLSGTSALYHNQRGHSFTPLLPQWNQRSISQSERPQFHPSVASVEPALYITIREATVSPLCCLSGTSALYHNQRGHSFIPLLPQWNQRSISQSERPQFHPSVASVEPALYITIREATVSPLCCLSGTSALYHNQRGHSFTPLLPQWNQRSISQSERPQFHPSVASVEPALYITIREATVSSLCCLSGTSALYHNQRGHSFIPLLPQWNQRSISQSERPQFHPSVASVEPALYITIREATVSPLCCLSGTSALYHNQRGHSFIPLLPQWNQRSISQSERPQFHPSVASVEPALYITIREATVSPLCCLSGTSALYHNQRGHSFTPLLPQWNQRSISQSERPQFHPSVASVEPALYITIREATVSPLCCLSGTSALYHNQRGHSFIPLLPQWNQRSISQSERPQFHPSVASVEPALYITIREATVSPLCCLSGTSALYHNQRGHSFTPLLPQWNQRSISQSERPQFHNQRGHSSLCCLSGTSALYHNQRGHSFIPLLPCLSGTSALYHNQRGHSFTPVASVEPALYITIREATVSSLLPQWNQRSISQSERPQFHPSFASVEPALYITIREATVSPLLPQWNQRSISQSERPQFHPSVASVEPALYITIREATVSPLCCLSGTSALYHNQRGHSFIPLLPQWNQRSISQSERPQFHPCCLSGTSALYHNQRGHSFTPLLPQWNQRSISQSERPQFHPSFASVEPALYITIREATVSPLLPQWNQRSISQSERPQFHPCCLSGTSALYHNQRGHSFIPLLPQWNQRSISQSERPQFHPSVASVEPALYITIREATVSSLCCLSGTSALYHNQRGHSFIPLLPQWNQRSISQSERPQFHPCCLSGTSALYHNQRGHSFIPLLPQWNQRSISQSERPQFHPSVASVEPALYITIREATVSSLCCLSGTSALYHNQRGHSFIPLLPQWNQRSISQSERPQFHPSVASVEPALYITIREATVSSLCCLSGTSALYHNQRGHSFIPLLPQWNQRSISQSERPQFHPSVASVEPALYITIREATVSSLCCLSGTSALYHNQRGHSFIPLLPQWNQRSISQSERPQFHPSVASVEPALYITIREATVSSLCCLSGTSALYHNQRGHSFIPLLPQWNQRSISQSERPQFHPSVASVEPALYITIREATVSSLCCLSGTSALYHNQRGHSFIPLLPQWNQRSISQSERPQFHPSVASVEPALYITIREATVSSLCCLSGTSALYHNQRGHSFIPLLHGHVPPGGRPSIHSALLHIHYGWHFYLLLCCCCVCASICIFQHPPDIVRSLVGAR